MPCRSPVGRVAAAALRLEVDLAGGGVADDRVRRRRVAFRRRALVPLVADDAVDVLGDGDDVVVGERQRRHAAFGAGAVHDRQDQLAVLIVQDDLRPQQVRARRSCRRAGRRRGTPLQVVT